MSVKEYIISSNTNQARWLWYLIAMLAFTLMCRINWNNDVRYIYFGTWLGVMLSHVVFSILMWNE